MDYHILEARYVSGHVLWLRFRDGLAGEIDLAPSLKGPVFEPLRNLAFFQAFMIHPEFHVGVAKRSGFRPGIPARQRAGDGLTSACRPTRQMRRAPEAGRWASYSHNKPLFSLGD